MKVQTVAAFLAVIIGAAFFAAIPPWGKSVAPTLYRTHVVVADCVDKKLPVNATLTPPQQKGPVVREIPN